MRSVNPQSMRRRYKNIAGLTCYIQLNGKQTKRPPHLLHCRRGRSTLKPLSLQLIFILCPQVFLSKSNVPCLLVLSRQNTMIFCCLIQYLQQAGFMVSTAGHEKGYENMIRQTSGLWTSNRILYCECSSWSGTDTQ